MSHPPFQPFVYYYEIHKFPFHALSNSQCFSIDPNVIYNILFSPPGTSPAEGHSDRFDNPNT
jgi:hypothetical protein